MSSISWVKIASWHILRFDDPAATACGLEVGEDDEVLEELPAKWFEDKSCETCLRIKAKADAEAE